MDAIEYYLVKFKFGGYWNDVQGQNRRKYEGGSQKTIKLNKEKLSFSFIKENVDLICPWLNGHRYELYQHINGTSPKMYIPVKSDIDLIWMKNNYSITSKFEMVVDIEKNVDFVITENERINLTQQLELQSNGINIDGNHNLILDGMDDGFYINQNEDSNVISIGSTFEDSSSLKQSLRTYSIKNNFALKIKASDKSRVIATCDYRGCPWRLRASVCFDGHSFEVKKLNVKHICPGINRSGNKQVTSSWVAQQITNIVKKEPDISPKQIGNHLETTYGISVKYSTLWRGREQARESLFGATDDNYKWVSILKSELLSRNPGSHITYTYDTHTNAFKRFYVSFKVCIDGFFAGCRPLIGVDACHLKSKYLGVLLSANCLDGNNGLFTIAFAIVESESKTTWVWFMRNLLQSFGGEVEMLAFISDMEKGLGKAIRGIFPNAEHRVCMRHLWKNLKKMFRCDEGTKLKSLVWSAANTFIKREMDNKMEEIFNISQEVHSYLLSLPYKWSKACFSSEIKNHYNTNNMAESFNAWVEEARSKPVVDLIDLIRGMIMEQRAQRKLNSLSWQGVLVPHVDEYIREITTRKVLFTVRTSSMITAEIEGVGERHEVNIELKQCTCSFWQITGLPCIHAIAFIGMRRYVVWHTYVDNYYHIHRYKFAYDGEISTMPCKQLWVIPDDYVQVGPPNSLRPRGRPKKRRFRSFLEGTKKTKSNHKCSRCGKIGHHRSTCKSPLIATEEPLPTATTGRDKLPFRRQDDFELS